jgi:HSP20 family protein
LSQLLGSPRDNAAVGASLISSSSVCGLMLAIFEFDQQRHSNTSDRVKGGQQMAEKNTTMTPREGQRLAQRAPVSTIGTQFSRFDRLADEIDRVFDDFGVGREWFAPRWGGSRFGTPVRGGASASFWAPDIEIYQRNDEFVVRADLPGLRKEDVRIDVTDNALTIQGERRQEEETERGGVYRSERSYGSFYRTIPLPEGAITDQAKATFKNGVLEITLPAPPDQVTRGRRLDIKEEATK